MPKHKYVVKVPRPHKPRHEPGRPITDLVRNQLLHLSVAQRSLPKQHHAPMDVYSIETDAQAAEYIRHITSKLHLRSAENAKPLKKKRPKRLRASTKNRGASRGRKIHS